MGILTFNILDKVLLCRLWLLANNMLALRIQTAYYVEYISAVQNLCSYEAWKTIT